MIIETKKEAESWEKQQETHLARVGKYRYDGYYIEDKGNNEFWIYPKNALTGETIMNAMPTKLWATPSLTPEQTYEIPMADDVELDLTGVLETDYTIRPRPIEWDQGYTGDQFNSQFDNEQFEV